MYVPDGTTHAFIPGVTGSAVPGPGGAGYPFVGDPFWTFQPELIVSYLKDGWNLSAAIYEEINTQNTATHYTTGNILHADFTATKTIGKWTFGPVAYYVGQVSDDSCPPATCGYVTGTALNPQRISIWAVGGLLGYNFGLANLSVWATQEVSAKASNAATNPALLGLVADPSLTKQGFTVFATLSYRLWAPEEPAKPAMYHK
jgi:Putative MetA-pathway of phenol degradation